MTSFKRIVTTTIPFAIVIIFVYLFADIVQLGLNLLTEVPLLWILATIVVYFLSWLIKGEKWRLLLPAESTSVLRSTDLILLGNFISLVLPAKSGDIARLRLLNREEEQSETNLSKSLLLSTILIDRVWDLFGIVIVALGIVIWFQVDIIDTQLTILLLFSLLVGLALVYLVLPRYSDRINSIIPEKLQDRVDRFLLGLTLLPLKKVPLMVFVSSLVWVLEGVILYLLIQGHGLSIPLWLILIAVLAANLTKIVPITPGGFVLYEVTIGVIISNLSSLTLELAIGVGILDSIFKNGYTLVWGFFSYLLEFKLINIQGLNS